MKRVFGVEDKVDTFNAGRYYGYRQHWCRAARYRQAWAASNDGAWGWHIYKEEIAPRLKLFALASERCKSIGIRKQARCQRSTQCSENFGCTETLKFEGQAVAHPGLLCVVWWRVRSKLGGEAHCTNMSPFDSIQSIWGTGLGRITDWRIIRRERWHIYILYIYRAPSNFIDRLLR